MAVDAIRKAFSRLRGVRGLEWLLLVIAAAAAVLLLSGAERGSPSAAPTELERRMESVLSCVRGAGRVRVLVSGEDSVSAFSSSAARISGVLVVAEGADDIRVSLELQKAVQALLNLDAERIEILSMKEVSP